MVKRIIPTVFQSSTDIDECQTANGGCHEQAVCANTDGARTCTCVSGFVGDGVQCQGMEPALLNVSFTAQHNCQSQRTTLHIWSLDALARSLCHFLPVKWPIVRTLPSCGCERLHTTSTLSHLHFQSRSVAQRRRLFRFTRSLD